MPSRAAEASAGEFVVEVRNLSTHFATRAGTLHAVDDVSLKIRRGETLGLVGESGCGKSMTALSVARLVPPPGRIVAGEILVDGVSVRGLSRNEMRLLRGRKIGFVFQDPLRSLNPLIAIGEQVAERIRAHMGLSRRDAVERTIELLTQVGIPRPKERLRSYPHQLSGGMRQRVMIAIALSCDPSILLADEPTTALDVTIQAQILDLIRGLSAERHMAVLLITHDLGVAAAMCDRICVMYGGRVVESGTPAAIFASAEMPYSRGLLHSLPRLDAERGARLGAIEGAPPEVVDPSDSCRFSPRCPHARVICATQEPELRARKSPDHLARCWGTEPDGWIDS
jgi:oligopeptide transport system ATP-binding protein